ncbi:SPOR domain-containing protein [Peribacillus butanolivorans]|uniref:SPOR domain-containing protein n=1 Tax=Peribacillus butanolivorans TaxID=421767 RepID=UPI00366035A7
MRSRGSRIIFNADTYKKNFDKRCKTITETLSGKKVKEVPKPVETKKVLQMVQVGAFSDEKNEAKLAAELKKKDIQLILNG